MMFKNAIPGVTDLATLNPALAKEWHITLNGNLKPSDVTAHSNKKVWWRCKEGHEWPASVNSRYINGCPYCAGRLAIPGKTDLATQNPALAAEWHPLLNGNLKPSNVTVSSGKKVWWLCEKNHEWEATVASRSNGSGCPYCAGQRAIPGKTDLATQNPVLAKEWHPSLNGNLKPSDVTVSSGKKVWWRCKEGHNWQTSISKRSNGSGCPYCANKRPIPGKTDLATQNPVLAAEWHPLLNGDLKPSNVTVSSGKKVWWHCGDGHEWSARIYSRNSGRGCPYCANKRPIPGKTDLATQNPILAEEWHPLLNGNQKPSDFVVLSNKKIWWRCGEGHEWQACISGRSNGSGCPYCAGQRVIPGKTDLATQNPVLAAEWHPTLNGDLKPSNVTVSSGKKVWWRCGEGHDWQASISKRSSGRGCPYCAGRLAIPGETDLATQNPVIAAEWHPFLNGNLKPSDFTVRSEKRVWWRCKEGHEWQASISNRSNGSGCPYCTRKRPIPGKTDLATQNPVLADKWHPFLNGNQKPSDFSVLSNKKVWWRCKEGHSWQARISQRSNGSGCPYCTGQLAILGETDLATQNPVLAAEWHSFLNGNLKPSDFTVRSSKRVWWRCKEGHDWQARISHRSNGSDCPYCFGKSHTFRNRLIKTNGL